MGRTATSPCRRAVGWRRPDRGGELKRQIQEVDAEVVKGTDMVPKAQLPKVAEEESIQKVADGGGADPGRSQTLVSTEAVRDGQPMGQAQKDDEEVSKGTAPMTAKNGEPMAQSPTQKDAAEVVEVGMPSVQIRNGHAEVIKDRTPKVQMRKDAEEMLTQKTAAEEVRGRKPKAQIQKVNEAIRDASMREPIRQIDAEVIKDIVQGVQIRKAPVAEAKDGEPKTQMQEVTEEGSIQKVAERAREPRAHPWQSAG